MFILEQAGGQVVQVSLVGSQADSIHRRYIVGDEVFVGPLRIEKQAGGAVSGCVRCISWFRGHVFPVPLERSADYPDEALWTAEELANAPMKQRVNVKGYVVEVQPHNASSQN